MIKVLTAGVFFEAGGLMKSDMVDSQEKGLILLVTGALFLILDAISCSRH
jgi:hypothetical protein